MIATLKRRSEFLRVRGGARTSCASFVLETRPRDGDAGGAPRFGFTVTKQLGGAVVRNRIRRRLREALRLVSPSHARLGHDYVLIARAAARERVFSDLQADFVAAFAALERPQRSAERSGERTGARRRGRGGAT